ncbi:MarR family transcriptional regulator [Leclercia adecarboxylata]|uniref:MarR family winged helix-turn-helix transcriptional regulator n=1 Tax=Leclercia adecarboxylata TaxID=83655 RepID=UPI002DB90649|nr:MarR family transcriptional regulator [Leclercia adecarboxylata]MEB6380197.1 MarR family transcriptional regulator [Leclercia adecarboxylata]
MELRQEAFHLLRQLFQQHTAHWQQALPELTKPQYAVLRSIDEHPGIEQVALTEAAVSSKATLAEMLSRMESRGLVKREADPADKRRRFIFLTPEGEALLRGCKPVGNNVDNAFLGRLTAEERRQFTDLVRKMMSKERE